VSFAVITLCIASQGVFIVIIVYFVIDSVRKLLDKSSYISTKGIFYVRQAVSFDSCNS
jgi:hypothetical protein